MAEIKLSILACQCLDQPIPDQETLKQEVTAWEKRRNQRNHYVDWQFTTADAPIKIKRLEVSPELPFQGYAFKIWVSVRIVDRVKSLIRDFDKKSCPMV